MKPPVLCALLAAIGFFIALNAASTAHAEPTVPTVVRAEPAEDWNAKFETKEGWIGGDAIYSAVLGPNRLLWIFQDSLFGEVKDGGRPQAKWANNVFAVQEGFDVDASWRFIAKDGRNGQLPAFIHPENAEGWMWPRGAARVGDRLVIVVPRIVKRGEGTFGFGHVDTYLAVVQNPDDKPEDWRIDQQLIPFGQYSGRPSRHWDAGVFLDGGFLYFYGYESRWALSRDLVVARAPADSVEDFSTWRFRTEDGWSDNPEDSASLGGGLGSEVSVGPAPGGKGYVIVYTEFGMGERIVGRFSETPYGPWSDPVLLYKCPKVRRGIFSYAGKAHPWANTDDTLLISYCTNSTDVFDLYRDSSIYRPRFARVVLKWPEE